MLFFTIGIIFKPENKKQLQLTNTIANAGMRVRRNIWNLYLHLCWLTVEQQFIPALAIASAVKLSKNHLSPFNFAAVINTLILDNFLPGFAPTLSSISLIITIFTS